MLSAFTGLWALHGYIAKSGIELNWTQSLQRLLLTCTAYVVVQTWLLKFSMGCHIKGFRREIARLGG